MSARRTIPLLNEFFVLLFSSTGKCSGCSIMVVNTAPGLRLKFASKFSNDIGFLVFKPSWFLQSCIKVGSPV